VRTIEGPHWLAGLSPGAQRFALWTALAVSAIGAVTLGYFGVESLIADEAPTPVTSRVAAAHSTPTPTAVPTPAGRQRLVIHATGDVNLDPRQLGGALGTFSAPWDGVRSFFGSDDLTIVNLECAPSSLGKPQDKQFTFRCDKGLKEMGAGGVDVANMANNHSGDFGPDALLDGRTNVRLAGVAPVGAGRDAREANMPAAFQIKGWKVAVLGFGGVVPTPGWLAGASHPGVANGYDTASMVAAVRAAAAQADLVLVAIHWGEELDTTPRADDVARSHALIEAGADAVFGHHAHRLQPLEFYKGRPIAYGLGNFVWPSSGPTAVAEVVVAPDGSIGACLLPARLGAGRPTIQAHGCAEKAAS
jgi:hypothetical protein